MSSSPTNVERALTLPRKDIGPALLAVTEDQWFDRKSSRIRPRDLADSLIGFANSEGGVLVVGLHGGRVEGTDGHEAHRNALRQAALDFTEPPVRARVDLAACERDNGELDHLLVFRIEASELVHTNRRDEVFLRVGDENRRLTFVQRRELLYDKGQATFESQVADVRLADFDDSLVESYAEALGASDPIRVLHARGLAVDGKATVAGCLLFAAHPQRLFPEAYVRVLRYRGTRRGTGAHQQLVGDWRIEGPIMRQLPEGRAQIAEAQPTRRALMEGGRFGDVPLVPPDAWLEGLVNAVVHRAYSLAGDHVRVEIFDDRIEIASPGRAPGLVDLSDPLNTTRFARNPRIARVCAELRFGQELGEGIRRMFEEMQHAGLTPPLYRQTSTGVHLTLSADPVDHRLDEQFRPEGRLILDALREADRLSTGEVAELIGLSRPVTIARLKTLEDAGLIRWIGKSARDPRAYWTLAQR